MKDEPIPPDHHISRHCKKSSLSESNDVTAASFYLRSNDDYLSVNWLEFLGLGDRDSEIAEIRRVLSTKITPGSTAKIAVLNVGQMKDHVRKNSQDRRDLRVLHRPDEPPDKPDPSHSGIFDTSQDQLSLTELIVQKVIETHAAK